MVAMRRPAPFRLSPVMSGTRPVPPLPFDSKRASWSSRRMWCGEQVPATFRGWLHGAGNEGLLELVVDRDAGLLISARSVGPHGGEVLGMLSLAVQAEVPIEALRAMVYAYPTFHWGIGEALGAYALGIGKVLDPAFQPLPGG